MAQVSIEPEAEPEDSKLTEGAALTVGGEDSKLTIGEEQDPEDANMAEEEAEPEKKEGKKGAAKGKKPKPS